MAQLTRRMQQASLTRVWSNVGQGGPGSLSMQGNRFMGSRPAAALVPNVSRRMHSLRVLCKASSFRHASRSALWSCDKNWIDRRICVGNRLPSFVDGVVPGRCFNTPGLRLLVVRGLSSGEASAVADCIPKERLARNVEDSSGESLASTENGSDNGLPTEGDEEGKHLSSVGEQQTMEASSMAAKGDPRVSWRIEVKETDEALLTEVEGTTGGSSEILNVVEEMAGSSPSSTAREEHSGDGAERGKASLTEVTKTPDEVSSAVLVEAEDARERSALVAEIRSKEIELEQLRSALKLVDPNQGESEEAQEAKPIGHPWPEWTRFLKQLNEGGYFVHGDEQWIGENDRDDPGMVKRACLGFARDRDDIFLHYSRKDLEVVARFGCPTTDRKVVNSGKRLRDFLAIDEVSVCKPCGLRSSCERADLKTSANTVASTPEVIRLLAQYALEVSTVSNQDREIPSAVQKSCRNLLKDTIRLAAVPRDPKFPKVVRQAETLKGPRREREGFRQLREKQMDLKPGDWKCEVCQYVNFARNRECRECNEVRPAPDMRPGDWRCPECHFVNFSRNQECHDCKANRPANVGYDSPQNRGTRYDRTERGSRYDRTEERGSRYDRSEERGGRVGVGARDRRPDQRSYGRRGEDEDLDTWGGGQDSSRRSQERGRLGSKSNGRESSGGRRSKHEEWKPDLTRGGKFDEDEDEEISDFDDIDDDSDEDVSDVDELEDEEVEDMRAKPKKLRQDPGEGRELWNQGLGRSGDKDTWWEDDDGSRSERSEGRRRGSRGGSFARGRGGRGGRGDFDKGHSRSGRSSSERSFGDTDKNFGRSSTGSWQGEGRKRGRGRGR